MRIKMFNQYFSINEAYGVSKSYIIFADAIVTSLIGEFEDFVNSEELEHKSNIIIKYGNLKTYIKDVDLWADFPVKEIKLEYTFKKTPRSEYISKYKRQYEKGILYQTTGAAHSFGNKNWSGQYSKIVSPVKRNVEHSIIVDHAYGIEIIKESAKRVNLRSDKFVTDIRSLVYHELNHTYETYKKIISSRERGDWKTLRDIGPSVSLTWADANKWGIPKDIYRKWSLNFGYLIYYMEPHEMRAKVQESAPYAEMYKSFEKYKKNCPSYDIANDMIDFDTNTFLSEMTDVIIKFDEESDVDFVLNKLRNMFLTLYEKNLKVFREETNLDVDKLKSMTIQEFVDFWRKRINNAGEDLKRRLNNQWYKINNK